MIEHRASLRCSAKRSLTISGHRTSISLEEVFWSNLRRLADERGISIAALVREIDSRRNGDNLSSAIRIFVFENTRQT